MSKKPHPPDKPSSIPAKGKTFKRLNKSFDGKKATRPNIKKSNPQKNSKEATEKLLTADEKKLQEIQN